MRRFVRLVFEAVLAIAVASSCKAADAKLAITCSEFANGGTIPDALTCKGANVNPALHFYGIPAEAQVLAFIVEDPDAPSGRFTHWLVWNIAPTTTGIGEKSVPTGASQGTNDFGRIGYGGPCPPSGTHRYVFRLLALDAPLELKPGAKRGEFEKACVGHVLARAEIMGRYSAH
ncbi:MAG: YbhB/YbcL family Raf kinase inhibitor-like protein [Chthoniobacterales bacterium]